MSIRFRDLRVWESENWRFFPGSPVNNVYGEPGWVCQDQTNGNLWVHGAGNNQTTWTMLAGGGTANGQKGFIALANGQQSYPLVFPVAFAAAPGYFSPVIAMPNNAGELFAIGYDFSTLTALGVTIWLGGVPTAASVGGFINWKAEL